VQEKIRKVFLQTGNVEAYLLLKRIEHAEHKVMKKRNKNNQTISLQT